MNIIDAINKIHNSALFLNALSEFSDNKDEASLAKGSADNLELFISLSSSSIFKQISATNERNKIIINIEKNNFEKLKKGNDMLAKLSTTSKNPNIISLADDTNKAYSFFANLEDGLITIQGDEISMLKSKTLESINWSK